MKGGTLLLSQFMIDCDSRKKAELQVCVKVVRDQLLSYMEYQAM